MKARQGRARRRGASLWERFGRFRAETEKRLAALEAQGKAQGEQLRAFRSEVLAQIGAGFSDIQERIAKIDRGQEVYAKSADVFIKFFGIPKEEKELLDRARAMGIEAAQAVLENAKEMKA